MPWVWCLLPWKWPSVSVGCWASGNRLPPLNWRSSPYSAPARHPCPCASSPCSLGHLFMHRLSPGLSSRASIESNRALCDEVLNSRKYVFFISDPSGLLPTYAWNRERPSGNTVASQFLGEDVPLPSTVSSSHGLCWTCGPHEPLTFQLCIPAGYMCGIFWNIQAYILGGRC